MPSPATTLQASNARSADVFQVHGFGVKSREQKCLRGPRSRKCRWLQGSSRCHSENPRFEDDKYRLRGTVGAVAPPVPFGSGQAHTPFEARYPTQNLRRIKQRRAVFWLSHLHHPTAPNEGEIYQQYEGNKV